MAVETHRNSDLSRFPEPPCDIPLDRLGRFQASCLPTKFVKSAARKNQSALAEDRNMKWRIRLRPGAGRIDDRNGHPQGELRGPTKLIKITEDVRKYAAEQGLAESEALEAGMQEKRKEFLEKGSELYAKT